MQVKGQLSKENLASKPNHLNQINTFNESLTVNEEIIRTMPEKNKIKTSVKASPKPHQIISLINPTVNKRRLYDSNNHGSVYHLLKQGEVVNHFIGVSHPGMFYARNFFTNKASVDNNGSQRQENLLIHKANNHSTVCIFLFCRILRKLERILLKT